MPDGVVATDWVANTRAAFGLGVDAVCGRAEIDPVEALLIAPALHADDAREVAYAGLLDEIHALVDPDPADPLPRHCENSGASIAVSVAAWRRAGGVPALPTGEDRGFLRALRRIDARIRHAPDVRVVVSGRLEGRAAGGMADTMARRMIRQDALLDADLEPALICLRRAGLRARARAAWNAGREGGDPQLRRILGREAELPLRALAGWLDTAHFGAAWLRIEAESPVLVRVPVSRPALDRHMHAAARILASLGRGARARAADGIRPVPPAAAGGRAGRTPDAELHPGMRLQASRNRPAAASPVVGVSVSPVQLTSRTVQPGRADSAHLRARRAISGGARK